MQKVTALNKDLLNVKRLQGSDVNVDFLRTERRQMELKLMQSKAMLEDVKANLQVKGEIFEQGKEYENQLIADLRKF